MTLLITQLTSVPSELCACARAHRFQRLRTRIKWLRTDISLHKRIIVDHKITITRQTTDNKRSKTVPIQAEDLFFLLHLISNTKKNTLILGEFPE